MAEGFESYHVPQQSRRDKLRVFAHNHPDQCVESLQGCAGLLPLYDPSLLSSDLLSCANLQSNKSNPNRTAACKSIKEENHLNLMSLYMDPQQQSSIQLNHSSIQDHINSNPFLFASQNLRLIESFNNGEVVYKSEPLSLSLSSNRTQQETSLPLELNLQRYEDSSIYNVIPSAIIGGCGSSSSNNLSRSSVPIGPFTGYGSILKGSGFLKPAQLLLEEICDVGCGINAENMMADSGLMDPWMENLSYSEFLDESVSSGDGGVELRKKSRLISMLNEVYRRYKYYYQQMQAVVASFESVAGLGNAAPFANLALKAMSKHFRNLKNAITDQLQFTNKSQNFRKDETQRFGNSDNIYSQTTVNNSGVHDQPVWRPQRGLPERSVTVLRSWLFEHFLHPYPTDTDKLMLAKQTGLSRNQVSNWFINARVRLWKPMVEEIHMLETRQSKKALQRDELNADVPNDHFPTPTSHASQNPSTSIKRTRNDFHGIPMGSTEDTMGLPYAHPSHHQPVGVGTSNAGGSGGVSLTLGLHQNNGIGLSETFPINSSRRFGLDSNSGEYALGRFEDQNRQFGRDFIGGQLLHDFVG